jgi:outer membrane protein
VGPALQLGTDYALSDRTVLNLDVRWHTMTVEIEDFASPVPSVQIDPLILGLGVGVRF